MNRGAIVSQGWKLMLKNKTLWSVAAIILIPQAAVQFILPSNAGIVWSLISVGVGALFMAFLNGALICMTINILEQRPSQVMQAFRNGFHWLPPLFVVYFLLALPIWLVPLVTGEPSLSNSDLSGSELLRSAAVLFLAEIPISLLCSAISVGAVRAIILENCTIDKSLQRGWRLLWSHLGDYWGIGIRLFLIFLAAFVPLSCVLVTLEGLSHPSTNQNAIITRLLTLIISVFLAGFEAAVWTLAFREWQKQERSEAIVVTG